MQIEQKQKEIFERRYLPPTSDIIFQLLFGRLGSEEMTKDLSEHILDVRAEINGKENCNIEMQMVDHNALIERILHY